MSTGDQDPRRAEGANLLSSSPVVLFHRMTALQQTLAGLRQDGYHLVQLNADSWHTEREMHADLAESLDFPEYYGNNLDAFNDCLRDVAGHAYGFPEDATGLVLIMTAFDRFAEKLPAVAHALLDIFAVNSRDALVDGEQLICLIQSTVPSFSPPPVGATPIMWNPSEQSHPIAAIDADDTVTDTPDRSWWRRRR